MNTTLTLELHIAYDSLKLPEKLILPIEEGSSGFTTYRQHQSDPLAAEQFQLSYAGEHAIQIAMRLTGRIALDRLPDLKLDGTRLVVRAGVLLNGMVLSIQHPQFTDLDFPNVPNVADEMVRDLVNQSVTTTLKDQWRIDLTSSFENMQQSLNQPIPFEFTVARSAQSYHLALNSAIRAPQFNVEPDGLRIKATIEFKPHFVEI